MIDAVITWVDGADPVHRAKRIRFAEGEVALGAADETRFASSGELRYAVLSVLRFAPFVRRIHILTDGQHPAVLDPLLSDPVHGPRLRVVDHRDAFGDHADLLPVFSSRSIETMVHRLPGLAERFLYLNDDIFIGRPMRQEDYFNGDQPILRGTVRRMPGPLMRWLRTRLGRGRPGYSAAQRAAARLVGRTGTWLMAEHQPHPMRRSTLATYYDGQSEALREQAGHRFRSAAQVSPIGLAIHLEMAAGIPVAPPFDVGYVRPGRPTGVALANVIDRLQRDAFASFCVQSLDRMDPTDRSIVLAGLEHHYAD